MVTILLLGDDHIEFVQRLLAEQGYAVVIAAGRTEALAALATQPALVIYLAECDKSVDELAFWTGWHRENAQPPFIFCGGIGAMSLRSFFDAGIYVLLPPIPPISLLRMVEECIGKPLSD